MTTLLSSWAPPGYARTLRLGVNARWRTQWWLASQVVASLHRSWDDAWNAVDAAIPDHEEELLDTGDGLMAIVEGACQLLNANPTDFHFSISTLH